MRVRSFVPSASALAFALVAGGCSWTPPTSPFAGPDPADPAVSIRPVTDVGVLGRYVSMRPVDPLPWREQNERVAPQPRR